MARFRSLLVLGLVASACAHLDAASRLDRHAQEHGFEVLTLDADGLSMRVYRRGASGLSTTSSVASDMSGTKSRVGSNMSGTERSNMSGTKGTAGPNMSGTERSNMSGTERSNMSGTKGERTLHVYLEGDGRPFVTPTRIAREPHAHDALAFRLMERDPLPSAYLGRPCYHPALPRAPCTPAWWTRARYGKPVVDAMSEAVQQLARDDGIDALTLIGYSGGGTLAVLIAEQLASSLPATDLTVVTLAANLDVGAWSTHHGYTPLEGSLDPATRPPLPTRIRQRHLVGANDTVVPPAHTEAWAATRPGAVVERVAGFDHRCCWVASWRERILSLNRDRPPSVPPP